MRSVDTGTGSTLFEPFIIDQVTDQSTAGRMYIDNMKVWMRPFDNDGMWSIYEQGRCI